jgi:hypothetical protein
MFDILHPGTGVDSPDIQIRCGEVSVTIDRYFTENRGLRGVCLFISNNCTMHADIIARSGKRIAWKKELTWGMDVSVGTRARAIRDVLLKEGAAISELSDKLPYLMEHCLQK